MWFFDFFFQDGRRSFDLRMWFRCHFRASDVTREIHFFAISGNVCNEMGGNVCSWLQMRDVKCLIHCCQGVWVVMDSLNSIWLIIECCGNQCLLKMPSIRAPGEKKSTTLTVCHLTLPTASIQLLFWLVTFLSHYVLQVAVKCRPLRERERGRDIVRVIESKVSSADCGFENLLCFAFLSIKLLLKFGIPEILGGACTGSWPVEGLPRPHSEPNEGEEILFRPCIWFR